MITDTHCNKVLIVLLGLLVIVFPFYIYDCRQKNEAWFRIIPHVGDVVTLKLDGRKAIVTDTWYCGQYTTVTVRFENNNNPVDLELWEIAGMDDRYQEQLRECGRKTSSHVTPSNEP